MMKISIGLKATEIVKLDSFHFDISNHRVLFQTQEFWPLMYIKLWGIFEITNNFNLVIKMHTRYYECSDKRTSS